MIRLYLWFCRVLLVAREPWVRWAPGLPCALMIEEGTTNASTRGAMVACERECAWSDCLTCETASMMALALPDLRGHSFWQTRRWTAARMT
jgi:hypothetical protein